MVSTGLAQLFQYQLPVLLFVSTYLNDWMTVMCKICLMINDKISVTQQTQHDTELQFDKLQQYMTKTSLKQTALKAAHIAKKHNGNNSFTYKT